MAPSSVNHLVVSCLLGSTLALPLSQQQRRDLSATSLEVSTSAYDLPSPTDSTPSPTESILSTYDLPSPIDPTPYTSAQDYTPSAYVSTAYATVTVFPETTGYVKRQDFISVADGLSYTDNLVTLDSPSATADSDPSYTDSSNTEETPSPVRVTAEPSDTPVSVAVDESPTPTPSYVGGFTLRARQATNISADGLNDPTQATGDENSSLYNTTETVRTRDLNSTTYTVKARDDLGENQLASLADQLNGFTSNSQGTADDTNTNANGVASYGVRRLKNRQSGSDSNSMESTSVSSNSISTSEDTVSNNYVADTSSESISDSRSSGSRLRARQFSTTTSGSDSGSSSDGISNSVSDSSTGSSSDSSSDSWRMKARQAGPETSNAANSDPGSSLSTRQLSARKNGGNSAGSQKNEPTPTSSAEADSPSSSASVTSTQGNSSSSGDGDSSSGQQGDSD